MTATRRNTAAAPSDDVVKGLVLMIVAILIAPAIDGFAKYLVQTVVPAQVVWARFMFQAVFMGVALMVLRRPLVVRHWRLQVARGLLMATTLLLFITALEVMPLADAIAVFFVEPFVLTLISVAFLGERIGWRRLAAIAFGFAGAMVVVQPSYEVVGLRALLPLGAAVSFATYLALTRKLAVGEDALMLQFTAGVAACAVMSLALGIGYQADIAVLVPRWPSAFEWLLMAAMGVIATIVHVMMVYAFRHAPAGTLAPFQYLEIIGATLLGLVVFGDFPTPVTWVGIAMIVGAGLYVFHRERRSARGTI